MTRLADDLSSAAEDAFEPAPRAFAEYRILLFDGRGRVINTLAMQCVNDDDALERLARHRHPHALELHQADRMVWRFETGPLL